MPRPKGAPRDLYVGSSLKFPVINAPARKFGRKNLYVCDTCRGVIATIDVDEGTTPAFLACRADGTEEFDREDKCKGMMQSQWYPPEPWGNTYVAKVAGEVHFGGKVDMHTFEVDVPDIEWEWYRPSLRFARRQNPGVLEHVQQGGLLLRKMR